METIKATIYFENWEESMDVEFPAKLGTCHVCEGRGGDSWGYLCHHCRGERRALYIDENRADRDDLATFKENKIEREERQKTQYKEWMQGL